MPRPRARGKNKRNQNGGSTDSDSSLNKSGFEDLTKSAKKKPRNQAESAAKDSVFEEKRDSEWNLSSIYEANQRLQGSNSAMSALQAGSASTSLESSGPVTNEQIMQQLKENGNALKENNKELARLSDMVERLNGQVHELQNSNDALKKEIKEGKEREETLRNDLAATKDLVNVAARRADELDQYIRRNNIRIYGVKEDGEDADSGLCERKILDIIHNKLELKDVTASDIEAAHRLNSQNSATAGGNAGAAAQRPPTRSIIVRFVSRKTRDSVLYNRRKLKNSGITMVEDLTKTNFQLYTKVKEDELCNKAWTKNGKVMMETKTGRVSWIKSMADLASDTRRRFLSSTPRSRRDNVDNMDQ